MPMASDALSPAAVHKSRNSSKRAPATFIWTRQAVPHSMVRGAMRIGYPVGVLGGQCVGDLSGALPAQSRSCDITVGRPCCGAHVPAVRGVQIAGGLEVFGDQRRVLVRRARVTLLDRGGQAPVRLGAIGFQLRFVGHRADQRVAEGVFGARGEPHLIDQLRAEQLVEHRHRCPARRAAPPRSGRRSPTPRSTSAWPGCPVGRCAPRWRPALWPAPRRRRHPRDRRSRRAHRSARRAAPTRAPSPRRKTGSRRPARR